MPTLSILAPEEVKAFEKKPSGQRKATEQQYDQLLQDLVPYTWARVALEDGDVKTNVRNRIKQAAKRRGLTTQYRRTRDESVIFQLVTNGTEPEAEQEEDEEDSDE
jgi:hypothetical protein